MDGPHWSLVEGPVAVGQGNNQCALSVVEREQLTAGTQFKAINKKFKAYGLLDCQTIIYGKNLQFCQIREHLCKSVLVFVTTAQFSCAHFKFQ